MKTIIILISILISLSGFSQINSNNVLKYKGDLSAQYDDSTLIPKNYVDALLGNPSFTDTNVELYIDPTSFYYDGYVDGMLGEIFLQNGGSTTQNSEFSVALSDEILFKIKYDVGGVTLKQLTGSLTDGSPTASEITSIVGYAANSIFTGVGFQVTIKDSDGTGLLYKVESDGTDWYYVATTKAL
jgi:hypothetical protein